MAPTALWSALFPVFWIGDPRSVPAASNVALYVACGLGLAGRPRAAWRLALIGGGLALVALFFLRIGGPVVFDQGGVNRGAFRDLYPGGVLWLLAFPAAAIGAPAARCRAMGRDGRRPTRACGRRAGGRPRSGDRRAEGARREHASAPHRGRCPCRRAADLSVEHDGCGFGAGGAQGLH